jgi:hypothetical protein
VRAVVFFFVLLPAAGFAQDSRQPFAESRLESVFSTLRVEKPRRSGVQDNLSLWQPSIGFGAQLDLDRNWGLRLDLGRQRPKFPGAVGRDNIDTVTLYLSFASL